MTKGLGDAPRSSSLPDEAYPSKVQTTTRPYRRRSGLNAVLDPPEDQTLAPTTVTRSVPSMAVAVQRTFVKSRSQRGARISLA